MNKEKSCGAVIFKDNNNVIEFLIEQMPQGHFAFPKGHVEGKEEELETASREIKEETNLSVSFLPKFREKTKYHPKKDSIKTVIYFLAEAKDISNLKKQDSEVKDILWLDFESAMKTITFQNDKEILRESYKYLRKINRA